MWFLIGWYSDTWYIPPKEEHLNCTAQQMADAAQYHFTTEAVMLSRENKITISGMTGAQFSQRLTDKLTTDPTDTAGFPEAPLAYDAVWAMALAFNCTTAKLTKQHMKLEHFTYTDDFMYKQLLDCMKDTRFPGVSVSHFELSIFSNVYMVESFSGRCDVLGFGRPHCKNAN